MNIIYNLEDIKNLQFNVQDVFNVCAQTISEVLNEHKTYNLNYIIKKLANNLLMPGLSENKIIYNTRIYFSLTPNEIFLYVALAYYDLKELTVSKFISQFEEEIIRFSTHSAKQRLEYLRLINRI